MELPLSPDYNDHDYLMEGDTTTEPTKPASSSLPLDEHSLPYRDFSKVSYEEVKAIFKPKATQVRFPVKLHHIVERSVQDGYSSLISWRSHGRAFTIHNEKLFLEQIIGRYFLIRKRGHFIRQLGVYGFRRIVGRDNPDRGCYFHALFLRSRPDLCSAIINVKKRCLVREDNEPDLTQFDPMPTSSDVSNALNHDSATASTSISTTLYGYATGSTAIRQLAFCNCPRNDEFCSCAPTTFIPRIPEMDILKTEEEEQEENCKPHNSNKKQKIEKMPPMPRRPYGRKENIHLMYRDFLHISDDQVREKAVGGTKPPRQEKFPVKLYRFIENCEKNGDSYIVSWNSHGRCFKIHNESLFLQKINFLNTANLTLSYFRRQIAYYGFRMIVNESSPDFNSYFHEMFLRTRQVLCHSIELQKHRFLIDRGSEPNFALYEPMSLFSNPYLPPSSSSLNCQESIECNEYLDIQSSQEATEFVPSDSMENITSCQSMPLTSTDITENGSNKSQMIVEVSIECDETLSTQIQLEPVNITSNASDSHSASVSFPLPANISSHHFINPSVDTLPLAKEYRDYLNILDEEVVEGEKVSGCHGDRNLFPEKLHKLISQSEEEGYSHIINWSPHGRSFKIHDEMIFIARIVGLFFRVSNMTHFKQQLGHYAFQRVEKISSEDKGAYFHELFLRGRPRLTQGINKQKKRGLFDRRNQPDFSLFDPLPSTTPCLSPSLTLHNPTIKNKLDDNFEQDIACDELDTIQTNPESIESIPDASLSESNSASSLPASTFSSENFIDTADDTSPLALLQQDRVKKYNDYLNVSDEDIAGHIKPVRQIFPEKLYALIYQYEEGGDSHIISWASHGRSFKIHDEQVFIKNITPFFRVSCMPYFLKSLGQYGFRKIMNPDNMDEGSFFHECFLRGKPKLCRMIHKQKSCSLIDKNNEPDFTLYDPMPSAPTSCPLSPLNSIVASENSKSASYEKDMVIDDSNTKPKLALQNTLPSSLPTTYYPNENVKQKNVVKKDTKVNYIHPELMKIERNNEALAVAVALFKLKSRSIIYGDREKTCSPQAVEDT